MPRSRKKTSTEKEEDIQQKMVKKLSRKRLWFKERPKLHPPLRFGLIRKEYAPDIVGINSEGKVFVIECKGGMINRPYTGLGKLLVYRRLIRNNFGLFRKQLIKKLQELHKNQLEKLDNIARRTTKDNVEYILALDRGHDRSRREFIEKLAHIPDLKVKPIFV